MAIIGACKSNETEDDPLSSGTSLQKRVNEEFGCLIVVDRCIEKYDLSEFDREYLDRLINPIMLLLTDLANIIGV